MLIYLCLLFAGNPLSEMQRLCPLYSSGFVFPGDLGRAHRTPHAGVGSFASKAASFAGRAESQRQVRSKGAFTCEETCPP